MVTKKPSGPVFSNISIINRAFCELGSPLPYDMLVEYVQVNWANGKGLDRKTSSEHVKTALSASFYFEEAFKGYYRKKEFQFKELDDLHDQLKETLVPQTFNSTNNNKYQIKDIYLDPRFDVMEIENGSVDSKYILLSEWELLNDLVIRIMAEDNSNKTVKELTNQVKNKYEINNENALFIPQIDNRFTVTKDLVSLSSSREQVIKELNDDSKFHVEVTPSIREQIAKKTHDIFSYITSGTEVKIRNIVKNIFSLDVYKTNFPAYFQAVREHLIAYDDIYLNSKQDAIIYMKANPFSNTRPHAKTISYLRKHELKSPSSDNSLTYTLRYYDRIQQTLEGSYFSNWIKKDDHLKVYLQLEDQTKELIFFFERDSCLLYGGHLVKLMNNFSLVPGQRLHFFCDDSK
ncbi:hypothetical protein [Natranaerobius trueperi]|uniref:Uncharacterized protein n=1 Tax=Natranaerobius trueperi TaxID=759412 RepID=A0A226C2P9_9FIRM|nr:hypothetical protein [Natranaerobius trueperi]OWZ84677.1 hypothetical protein CDO51_02635 [Natranaerobius trueperi]